MNDKYATLDKLPAQTAPPTAAGGRSKTNTLRHDEAPLTRGCLSMILAMEGANGLPGHRFRKMWYRLDAAERSQICHIMHSGRILYEDDSGHMEAKNFVLPVEGWDLAQSTPYVLHKGSTLLMSRAWYKLYIPPSQWSTRSVADAHSVIRRMIVAQDGVVLARPSRHQRCFHHRRPVGRRGKNGSTFQEMILYARAIQLLTVKNVAAHAFETPHD